MLMGFSNKIDYPQKSKNEKGIINNNYVIDASIDNENATIRETKFVFVGEKDYSYNDHLVDCFGLGPFSVFHTFKNSQGESL